MPSPTAPGRRKKVGQPSISSPASMNFRSTNPVDPRQTAGTKPLPNPSSVQHVILLMVVHLCKKILFIEEYVKVAIYLGSLFIGSVIADVAPLPRTYLARKDNLFNVYFVKYSWAWTTLFVFSFLYMTSRVYTCRNKDLIKRHLYRILIATGVWYLCTSFFVKVENNYGACSKSMKVNDKYHCTSLGHRWYPFSISGHAFILIYCSLLIKEEAKALVGWDGIKDMIRNEEHNRSLTSDADKDDTQLHKLSDEELANLKDDYELFTPYIRGVFIGMTLLSMLWDVMLIATILYFHTMVEKFLGGVFAILMWFLTYRLWYRKKRISPGLAGEGPVSYLDPVEPLQSAKLRRRSSLRTLDKKDKEKLPTFMGMPLYSLRNQELQANGNAQEENSTKQPSKSALEV